jgi:hypothetical protein
MDLDIVVLSNTNGLHVQRISDTIAKWVFGIPMPVAVDEPRSPQELERYVGVYRGENNREWPVTRRGSQLFLTLPGIGDTRLRAQPDGAFVPRDLDYTRITFHLEGDRAGSLTAYQCVPSDHERCMTQTLTRIR